MDTYQAVHNEEGWHIEVNGEPRNIHWLARVLNADWVNRKRLERELSHCREVRDEHLKNTLAACKLLEEALAERDNFLAEADLADELLKICRALNNHLGPYIKTYEDRYPDCFSAVDMRKAHKELREIIAKTQEELESTEDKNGDILKSLENILEAYQSSVDGTEDDADVQTAQELISKNRGVLQIHDPTGFQDVVVTECIYCPFQLLWQRMLCGYN